MDTQQSLYSVIIPVFNGEKTIEILSVELQQLFDSRNEKFELIDVDLLSGARLSWAVATLEGLPVELRRNKEELFDGASAEDGLECWQSIGGGNSIERCYDKSWADSGPIIEREQIEISGSIDKSTATAMMFNDERSHLPLIWVQGVTYLEAALRCYVISKVGNTIEVPVCED